MNFVESSCFHYNFEDFKHRYIFFLFYLRCSQLPLSCWIHWNLKNWLIDWLIDWLVDWLFLKLSVLCEDSLLWSHTKSLEKQISLKDRIKKGCFGFCTTYVISSLQQSLRSRAKVLAFAKEILLSNTRASVMENLLVRPGRPSLLVNLMRKINEGQTRTTSVKRLAAFHWRRINSLIFQIRNSSSDRWFWNSVAVNH